MLRINLKACNNLLTTLRLTAVLLLRRIRCARSLTSLRYNMSAQLLPPAACRKPNSLGCVMMIRRHLRQMLLLKSAREKRAQQHVVMACGNLLSMEVW